MKENYKSVLKLKGEISRKEELKGDILDDLMDLKSFNDVITFLKTKLCYDYDEIKKLGYLK